MLRIAASPIPTLRVPYLSAVSDVAPIKNIKETMKLDRIPFVIQRERYLSVSAVVSPDQSIASSRDFLARDSFACW